jgi:hypothetical protein
MMFGGGGGSNIFGTNALAENEDDDKGQGGALFDDSDPEDSKPS